MKNEHHDFTEVRSDVEDLGNSFALFVTLSTSDIEWDAKSKLGLFQHGQEVLSKFEDVEARLRRYKRGKPN